MCNRLGEVQRSQGKAAAAETILRDAADNGRRLYGTQLPAIQRTAAKLGRVLVDQTRFSEVLVS